MFILSESDDDSDMVIKSLSGNKQSNTAGNVHDSNKKYGIWAKTGD